MENYEFWATIAAIIIAAIAVVAFISNQQNKFESRMESRLNQMESRFENRFVQIENRLAGLEQRVSTIEGWIMGRSGPPNPPAAD